MLKHNSYNMNNHILDHVFVVPQGITLSAESLRAKIAWFHQRIGVKWIYTKWMVSSLVLQTYIENPDDSAMIYTSFPS